MLDARLPHRNDIDMKMPMAFTERFAERGSDYANRAVDYDKLHNQEGICTLKQ